MDTQVLERPRVKRAGRFSEVKSLYLTPEMLERLERLSERDSVDVNSLIRQAISRRLDEEGV